MRLIDADKLKKDVLNLQDCYNGFSDTYDKSCIIGVIDEQPSAQPDKDMIHLQKEQAYMQGWEDGRKALREEIWEDGRDRLD